MTQPEVPPLEIGENVKSVSSSHWPKATALLGQYLPADDKVIDLVLI